MPKLLTGWRARFLGLSVSPSRVAGLRVISAPPVFYGKTVLQKSLEICEQEFLNLENIYIITGPKTYKIAGKAVADALKPKGSVKVIKSDSQELNEQAIKRVARKVKEPSLLVGVGGGSKIDLTKLVATEKRVPFVLVPTALSHDGIASNFASLNNATLKTKRASLILADHNLLAASSTKFAIAGFGDVISNYSAAFDWKIASQTFGRIATNYSRKIHLVSWLSAQLAMEVALLSKVKSVSDMLEELVLGLVASAAAMNSANSSIPCSGTEHTLEKLLKPYTDVLHGTLCAVVALPVIYLQAKSQQSGDWRLYRKALRKIGLPTSAREIGLDREQVSEAFYKALSLRAPKSGEKFNYKKHRYGILNQIFGKTKSKAKYLRTIGKALSQTGF